MAYNIWRTLKDKYQSSSYDRLEIDDNPSISSSSSSSSDDNNDDLSPEITSNQPSYQFLRQQGGAEKASGYDAEPLIDMPYDAYATTSFINSKEFVITIMIIMFFSALAIIGFSTASIVETQKVQDKIDYTISKIGTCNQEQKPLSQNEKIFIGSISGNQTSILDTSTSRQLRLNHKNDLTSRGRPAWVIAQNEIWIPDTALNKIDVYQSLSMNLIYSFSTLNNQSHVPCYGPSFTSYHPLAGPLRRGQVWVSCTTALYGWAVYDPETYTYITFVPLPVSLGPFVPYDIATGQYLTIVSLKNTSATGNANLIQYNNTSFLPVLISQTVGHWPLLSYSGNSDSFLYVSSYYAQEAYKINFTSLLIEHTWTSIPTAFGITTDPTDTYLYVTEAGSSFLHVFSTSNGYAEATLSPYTVNIPNPVQVKTNLNGKRLFITNNSSDSLTSIYDIKNTDDSLLFFQNILTGSGSFFLTNNAITCVCELCQYF